MCQPDEGDSEVSCEKADFQSMLCPSNFIEISGKMHEFMGFSGFPLGI